MAAAPAVPTPPVEEGVWRRVMAWRQEEGMHAGLMWQVLLAAACVAREPTVWVEAVVRAARREGEGGGEALIESMCHLLSYSHHGCEGQQGRAVMAMAARAGASLLGWRGLE